MDISLALGGGGAKGNSHIGVLRKLEQEGFRIRAIAGTSFGGIVSVFYASGHSPAQIEDLFAKLDQSKLYGHDARQGPSLLGLAGAARWLESVFGDQTFDNLKIPCALTAVDLNTGREVTLAEGGLVDAILATIAIPGIFPPHRIGEWELVDGGVLNPVPVSVARSLAPSLPVVAVTLNESLGTPARTWSMPMPSYLPRQIVERIARLSYAQAFDIFLRSLDVADRALSEYRLKVDKPEVIIRPAVSHIDLLERVDVRVIACLGDEAVEAVLPKLKREATWSRRFSRKLFGDRN
jgi:NTE family protein